MIKDINISGFNIKLRPFPDNLLNDIPVDIYVRFYFLEGSFRNIGLCFLENKAVDQHLSPAKCKKISGRISALTGYPVVFIFDRLMFVQRQRMIEQGVYFVISGKYANLPNLFVNAIDSPRACKSNGKLSPVAQYLLLYYLQNRDKEFDTIAKIQRCAPFSYLQISRALVDLELFGLCESENIPGKGKKIVCRLDRKALWDKSQPYLRNPVKRISYTDSEISVEDGWRQSGINALAGYTDLSMVRQRSFALDKAHYSELEKKNIDLNPIEGKTSFQEWIYPPTISEDESVDALSLWLTMQGNTNPRIESALEHLIKNIKW